GDTEDALSQARKAVSLAGDNWEIISWLGTVLRRTSQAAEALAQHDRALELAPEEATLHVERGRDLWALERWEPAQEAFDRARALAADVPGGVLGSAATRTARAVALKRAGELAPAVQLLEEALALTPYPAARANLALVALASGDTERAATIV